MAYRVALGTGFRVKELRSLTPASFDLDGDPPTVTVAAAYSQATPAGRATHPARLGGTVCGPGWPEFARDEQLFRLPHNTSKMFQRDLAAARAAWIGDAKTDAERDAAGTVRLPDATRTRRAKWPTSTPSGIRTFPASWPAGHRSRRPKSWPGIPRRF